MFDSLHLFIYIRKLFKKYNKINQKMTKKYVFLQVRSNSKRLPNKCLYPILENPNILLLYKRIVSKHYKIILLTSKDKTDDYLVNLLKKMIYHF